MFSAESAGLDPLVRLDDSKVAQDSPGLKRVCYGCESGDLFLWVGQDGQELEGFQLTYYCTDEGRREYVLFLEKGLLKTGEVDSKEVDGRAHDLMTPMVRFHSEVNTKVVAGGIQFLEPRAKYLPPDWSGIILKILNNARKHPRT